MLRGGERGSGSERTHWRSARLGARAHSGYAREADAQSRRVDSPDAEGRGACAGALRRRPTTCRRSRPTRGTCSDRVTRQDPWGLAQLSLDPSRRHGRRDGGQYADIPGAPIPVNVTARTLLAYTRSEIEEGASRITSRGHGASRLATDSSAVRASRGP